MAGDKEVILTACDGAPFLFPNDLAFEPDGHLYVSETVTGTIYHYRFSQAWPVGSREVFGHVLEMECAPKSFGGPDGMAFGRDGRLFVAM